MNQDIINEAEWNNDNNWTMPVGFYFSKSDSRWIVPRKPKFMGWTFNLGNKIGAWVMLLMMLFPTVLMLFVLYLVVSRSANVS